MIIGVTLLENNGAGVNISLGTLSGGAQVLGASAVGASDILPVPSSSLLLLAWVTNQSVFIASASWGGASITAKVWYLT